MKKRFIAIAVLCFAALPVFAKPSDSISEVGTRVRDRILRIIRIVTTGDGMLPPWPAPPPPPNP